MKARHEFWCVVIVLAVLGAAVVYCDYRAYRARFPAAGGWTYFFQR
jgi:hypothetical protein